MERPCGPHAEQHHQERTWRTSDVLHKRRGFPGEEKEILASEKGEPHDPAIRQAATPPMARVSVCLNAHANPSAQTKALALEITRTSLTHRA
jgi:hypothetical protein